MISRERFFCIVVIMFLAGCTERYGNLGVQQVVVADGVVPDSIGVDDLLVVSLVGSTPLGNCLTLSHADVEREATQVSITLWANARYFLGGGPPPPCGTVEYRYEGLPPFTPGWFRIIANQPDSSAWLDSVLVVP